ncbi:hypothetical protein [Priestia koreensis]|uniref:hypothetical protein n=1 Tax=Priestia koreensis TaxID=284581 RepID=UPI001F59612A|nr:hypothetical protein [Priestia koreensis]MCM3005261.1 hypothetical protein [Priestia koreensis]UNL86478.1 hypothetical protein IE339_08325 [Priestia koreensis]
MIEDTLRSYVGFSVEVVTPLDLVKGTLLAVTSSTIIVQTPGDDYGPSKNVNVLLPVISYVRVLTDGGV